MTAADFNAAVAAGRGDAVITVTRSATVDAARRQRHAGRQRRLDPSVDIGVLEVRLIQVRIGFQSFHDAGDILRAALHRLDAAPEGVDLLQERGERTSVLAEDIESRCVQTLRSQADPGQLAGDLVRAGDSLVLEQLAQLPGQRSSRSSVGRAAGRRCE